MALRSKTTTAIAVAGTTIAHGLTNSGGTATAPDELWVLATVAQGAGQTYRYAASDATNVYLASGTSASSADVFFAINHSICK